MTDTLAPLERLVKEEAKHIKIENISFELIYYSSGHYLYSAPNGLNKDFLPTADSVPSAAGETEILQSAHSLLVIEPDSGLPLLEKISQYARDRGNLDSYSPGARREKARFEELRGLKGEALRAIAVRGAGKAEDWKPSFLTRYRLLVDGKPVTVILICKPYGGASRVLPALARRRSEIQDPALLINLGTFAFPDRDRYGLKSKILLKKMLDAGMRMTAFAPDDIENGWDELLDVAAHDSRVILLASNLKMKPSAQGPAVHDAWVEEIDGIKIGVISLLPASSAPILARHRPDWTITDPIAAARKAIRKLRTEHKVDFIVAVSHLSSVEDAKLQDVAGIDLLLGSGVGEASTKRHVVVELSDWSRDNHYQPALKALPNWYSYGEVAVDFRRADEHWEPVRLEEVQGPIGPDLDRDAMLASNEDAIYGAFSTASKPLLPDPRRIWVSPENPKMTYAPSEFWNLAAQIVRRRTGAEISLLRIHRFNSNNPGEMTENFVATWVQHRERLVLLHLDGNALRSLLPRIAFDQFPILDEDRRFDEDLWLAQAGLNRKGLVRHLPLRGGESYLVATTEDLLKQTELLPALKDAKDVRPLDQSVAQIVLPWLAQRRVNADPNSPGRRDYEQEIRAMAEGDTPERPEWRLDLRELSAQFSNTQVNNAAPFSQVPDARVQANSQVQGQGTARLFSEYYYKRWRWDTGATGRYGEVIIKPPGQPQIENKTQDQLLLETELRHRTLRWERDSRGYSFGPFANVAYNTEFTPSVTAVPIRHQIWVKPGFKVFEGASLRDLHVAAVIDTDRTFPQTKTEYGFETGFEWSSTLPGSKTTVEAKGTYLQLAPNHLDNLTDLRRQLELSAKLGVPIIGALRLSPFIDFFYFDSKVLPQRGYNLLFGISLEFSRLWKPVY